MQSPFPQSTSVPGRGDVHLTLLAPSTPVFSKLSFTYPLKLLPSNPHRLDVLHPDIEPDAPTNIKERGDPSEIKKSLSSHQIAPSLVPLLFILTYGGGLLAGDCIDLTLRLDPYTRLTVTTQGSTKVYKNTVSSSTSQQTNTGERLSEISSQKVTAPFKFPSFSDFDPKTVSKQDLHVTISNGAGLWIGPDPIQPFKRSRYAQKQVFEVERGGSIGLVDWVAEGRRARGESWLMDGWRGRNEIWDIINKAVHPRDSEKKSQECKILLIRDSVVLQPDTTTGIFPSLSSEIGIIGTIILHGPLFTPLSAFFLSEFQALPRIGARNWDPILSYAEEAEIESKLSDQARWRKARQEKEKQNGLLWTAARVRGGATVVKFAAREIEGARAWIGAMLKEEGSIGRDFGPGGLMFVR